MQAETFPITLETPDGEKHFECRSDEFIWNAAARNSILLPSICHQGRCLTCASCLLEGEVDQSAAKTYFPQDKQARFILPCTAKPKSALRLRTHQQHAMRLHRAALSLPAPYL